MGHGLDRLDVEAPRGVEPTSTNRRGASRFPIPGGWGRRVASFPAALDGMERVRSCGPEGSVPRPFPGSRAAMRRRIIGCCDSCGGHGPGETPSLHSEPGS